jgi:excisionase family DNA binding protein
VLMLGGGRRIAMTQEKFMTTKEVAQYLRVDQYTIYRLVTQKKIPAFKIGNQWRFKRSVLERWLKTKMNIPSAH